MTNTTDLANKINSFNYYFDMTSDDKKYQAGLKAEGDLRNEIATLSIEDRIELKTLINGDIEKLAMISFGELFENLVAQEKSELSKLMSAAWTMVKKGIYTTISEALKASWKRAKLIKQLKNGIAYFTFKKATGELRDAIGTLRDGNFNYVTKSSSNKSNIEVIKYFDLQAQAWRSCRVDRLVAA